MLHNLIKQARDVDDGSVTMGQVGRTKAMASHWTREVLFMCREMCGGNGILLGKNNIIKHLLDVEVGITAEGSYEVNSLVSGRELTGGLAAFK
mmetsp:Transcript_12533/g.19569  ORF Transcript_12533/g.19569 Transcript_12533/m.19569 type:complete len:93 (+) Transcript_12533:991-1269(+)